MTSIHTVGIIVPQLQRHVNIILIILPSGNDIRVFTKQKNEGSLSRKKIVY